MVGELHLLAGKESVGVDMPVKFVVRILEQYMQIIEQGAIVLGNKVGEEEVGIKKVVFLGIVPIDIDGGHHFPSPLLEDGDEIIVVDAYTLDFVSSRDEVPPNELSQFFLVVLERTDIDLPVLRGVLLYLLFDELMEQFELFGGVVGGCDIPIEVVEGEDLHDGTERNESDFLGIESPQEMGRQCVVERACLADGEDELYEGVKKAVFVARFGFRPKEILPLGQDESAFLTDSDREIDIVETLCTVIVGKKILPNFVFDGFFGVFEGVYHGLCGLKNTDSLLIG
mgnify:CR=1 FL=1